MSPEYVRDIEATMKVAIDTNKMTYSKTFTIRDYEPFQNFLARIEEWHNEIMEMSDE